MQLIGFGQRLEGNLAKKVVPHIQEAIAELKAKNLAQNSNGTVCRIKRNPHRDLVNCLLPLKENFVNDEVWRVSTLSEDNFRIQSGAMQNDEGKRFLF